MRLFISINFDSDTKKELMAVQNRLRGLSVQGTFTRPENLHLTLAFLGEIGQNRLAPLRQAMDAVPVEPMDLVFDHAGMFHRTDGDIWWAGIQSNPTLSHIQAELCRQLTAKGFLLENRSIVPHLTLARRVLLSGQAKASDLLPTPFHASIRKISLMQSERIQGILTYTERCSKSS